MPKYDVTKLMYVRSESDRLINKLDVDDYRVALMKAARTKVRNAIKTAFTAAKTNETYMARMNAAERTAFINIEPRFWPQGSLAYGTQNMPSHTPPQQIDVDDGVYLPIEALRDKPIVLKQVFFEIVDTALKELAVLENWGFDDQKSTCVRVELDAVTHLDVPLYAIPIERFDELQKAMGRAVLSREAVTDDGDINLRALLGEQKVYLALRERPHWKESDPIRIQEWFEGEQKIFGSIFTRTCRYLKAWRDFNWFKGGPSSIALMICVWETFNDRKTKFYTDSEALLAVARELPARLEAGVKNPVAPEETVFPRDLDDIEFNSIIRQTTLFSEDIRTSLESGTSRLGVVETMIKHWGTRVPHRADWVVSASSATAAVVTSTPAEPQPKPEIETMRSGTEFRSG
ncbi:CBASS cGAMP synthase [Parahaliea aestuarii]|uniref:Cyclic GMP-AMP synthase n=1 Tax=Parahaliea aestuarii TaxID=1852021 RepID=A0A5C8ZS58_9GAMM|nr:hypothetical protein [Parahaliea aestuarii]TXS90634.1 hypothetical protein FVW59_14980 [Parahaliea aestuarii]